MEINEHYAQFNEEYEQFLNTQKNVPRLPHRIEFLIRSFTEIYFPLGLRPGSNILDIGCGLGELCYYLQRFGLINCQGLDINLAALNFGHITFPDLSFYNALTEQLPFRNSSFDTVISRDVFEHFPTIETAEVALLETDRVCKGDTMLHIITVLEDIEFIHQDPTHTIKKSACWWKEWFKDHGWITIAPLERLYFSRYRLRLIQKKLHGFYLLKRVTS